MSECPTCGKECESERGMKVHHATVHNESLALLNVKCGFCGTKLERYESEVERSKFGPFCDRKCGGDFLVEKWKREGHPNDDRSSKEWTPKGKEHPFYNVTGEEHPAYGHEHSEETIEKIRKSSIGENNAFYGKTHSEETIEHLSEVCFTEEHPLYGLEGEEHPSYGYEHSEETKKLMSEKSDGFKSAGKEYVVEKTGHHVRSSWEGEIDLILNDSKFNYSYEGRGFGFNSEKYNSYLPDFIVEDKIIIEVKGRIWGESCKEKPQLFQEEYPKYEFVVIGSEKVPSDHHLEWEDRKDTVDLLENILKS